MNIRPRIPIYLAGNIIIAPLWYIDRYGGRTALLGWNKNKRYDNANLSLILNDHLNAGDLNTVYTKNKFYTDNPAVVSSDILSFYDSDGNEMSAKDYEKFYNSQADIIRSHWALNLTYGLPSAETHNSLYRRMFKSRSNPDLTKGSDYNIGYQENQLKIEGSSTWLRRMDLYEKDDLNNPDRIHEITLKDGTKARYYKENNGNIRLLENNSIPDTIDRGNPIEKEGEVTITGNKKSFEVPATGGRKYGFDWSKISNGLQKVLTNPDLYATGRLVGNLAANEKIYGEALKGIRPNLMLIYQTHRLVVGDEATKQGFYRRAALGLTKAARPFTSDADRQMTYQFEAKRVGDELRAQGDLADNQEIRRTSDESNQHQWANQQRATEVANANNASINQANSLKHNLLALKHAAQWSSIDNFLKEVEYRKRQQLAEDQALDKQIWLSDLDDIQYTPQYIEAYKKYNDTLEKHKKADGSYDEYHPDIIKARADFYNIIKQLRKLKLIDYQNYKRNKNLGLLTAKYGTKVTRKKKDDLLYKSTRDVVEHFRRMSKMSSDAQNRKTPKIEKLTSHPKSGRKAWKFQQGGLAPFVVYTPVSMGGETSRTTSSDSSSSRASSSKKEGSDVLDMIKELFKEVVGKGLPSDVNSLYTSMLSFLNRSRMFGSELSTDDIASMYVLQMLRLNQVLYLKGIHDKAEQSTILNNAVNEFAITYTGKLVGYNSETGKISYIDSLAEAKKEGVTPLTNGLLLSLRASDPNFANHTELDLIAANGVGMTKIAEFLKAQLPHLGSSILDNTIEGYTKKDSKDIIEGLKLLLEAPEGDYKFNKSQLTKDLTLLANKAIQYLAGILPDNMKKVLNIRAELGGISASDLIASLVSSGINYENKSKLEFDAVTGKAASNKDGNSEGDGNMLPSMAFFNGEGEKSSFIILDKTNDGLRINTISTPITSKGYNTGSITFNKLESSDFGGQLLINQATMGDSLISSTGRNNIIIDGRIYLTELPIDQEAKRTSGIIKPDLRFLKNIEKADSIIRQKGLNKFDPKDIPAINKIYQENNLPILYTISNNKPTITSEYARFAIVNGIGTEKAFGDNPEFNDAVQEISSDKERELFEIMMQQLGNSKYKLNNGVGLFGYSIGETKLYKGTIYIPMVASSISALAGTGFKAKVEEYNLIEAKQLAADAAREMGFNPAGDISNLK